jgi:predicted TIM-barrel fold metal-dependent hydrolase
VRDGVFVADCHAHLFPQPTRLYGRSVHYPVDALINNMDQHGIDYSLVIARPTQQLNPDGLRALHDDISAAIAQHPNRLGAFCWGVPRFGAEGVAEIERCWNTLGYRGLKLHPAHEQFLLDDPESIALIQAADRRRMPVMVYTDSSIQGAEPWRLVFVAKEFPDTTFLMSHVGGSGSELQNLSTAKLAATVPNVALEVSTTVTDPAATFFEPARILGPERVYYGSDSPIHPVAVNLLKMDLLELDTDWRQLMLGENLRRLLKNPD